jgi:hypothetical protein
LLALGVALAMIGWYWLNGIGNCCWSSRWWIFGSWWQVLVAQLELVLLSAWE